MKSGAKKITSHEIVHPEKPFLQVAKFLKSLPEVTNQLKLLSLLLRSFLKLKP